MGGGFVVAGGGRGMGANQFVVTNSNNITELTLENRLVSTILCYDSYTLGMTWLRRW